MSVSTPKHDRPGVSDRALRQRMDALARANEVRLKRGNLKRDVASGRISVTRLLVKPPKCLHNAKVIDMLMAVPYFGPVKSTKVLVRCDIALNKTIGGLTDRQRSALVSRLRERSQST
jgi:hypothetical protein